MNTQNINMNTAPYGAFALRVSLGIMFVAHGLLLKYFTFTLGGTAQFFESIGYPGFLAYVVFAAETLGGLALIVGFQTRLVSFALIPILIGATMVHLLVVDLGPGVGELIEGTCVDPPHIL